MTVLVRSRILGLLALLAVTGAAPAAPAPAPAGLIAPGRNLIVNGDFEQDGVGWKLVDGKGRKCGAVMTAPDGNRVLAGQGSDYFLASTARYFEQLPAELLAGKRLKLTFSAKGDEDAYPGAILVAKGKDRSIYQTLFWKTKYYEKNITLTDRFVKYERTTKLPDDIEKVYAVRLFNCTRRGRVLVDDIRLCLAAPAAPAAPASKGTNSPDWHELAFSDEELIELSNTCNRLVTQWAELYGASQDLDRAAFYAQGFKGLSDERLVQLRGLRDQLMTLRQELKGLQEFYIGQFKKKFGRTVPPLQPWRFYRNNDHAGRKLIFAVGDRRSRKKPFVELEARFAEAQATASALLAECRRAIPGEAGAATVPSPPEQPPRAPLFDRDGRPTRILIGVRTGPDQLTAYRSIGFDFYAQLVVYAQYDADGNMLPAEVPQAAEREHWGLPGVLRPLLDPYIWWLPSAFRERCRDEPELWAHTERGPRLPSRVGNRELAFKLNYFHEDVVRLLEKSYEQYARQFKDYDDLAGLYYAAEFGPRTSVDGIALPFGYSRAARQMLRDRLKARFGAIEELNRAWGARYGAFSEIEPPTRQTMTALKSEDLPLIYEFRKLRKDRFAEVFGRIYAACHRGWDKPVMTSGARAYMNGNSLDAFDAFRTAEAVDIYCNHSCCDGSYKHAAEQVYYDSIARYLGNKPRGTLEYYPGYPEIQHFDWATQDTILLFRRVASNLWHEVASGNQFICVWPVSTHYDEGTWRHLATNYRSGFTLVCDFVGAVPLLRRQIAGGVAGMLLDTEIVTSRLGLLAPYDATLICQPDGQIMVEAAYIHKFLADRNYSYQCVPEELIVDGRESLASYSVLIAPYTLWASDALQRKLLDWVVQGGILIAVAPFGIWNEYGQPSRMLLDSVFGRLPMELTKGEVYKCAFPHEQVSRLETVKIEAVLPYQRDQINLISGAHGRGRVYLTADSGIRNVCSTSKKVLLKAIDEATGVRTAWCRDARFDLTTRANSRTGARWLCAINRSVTEPAEDTVMAVGEYERPVDLCAPGGLPVAVQHVGGVSVMKLRLGPGEGTCIRLGLYREPKIDGAKLAELCGAGAAERRAAVLAPLRGMQASPDPVATAKARVCRRLALALMGEGELEKAAEFARRAAEFSRAPASPVGQDAYASAYTAVPLKIDGDAADWTGVEWTPFGTARFKAKWDLDCLYFVVDVKDDRIVECRERRHAWSGDGIELYLDILGLGGHRKHGLLDFQYIFACDGARQLMHKRIADLSASKVEVKRTTAGFVIEVAIAHTETGLMPAAGYELAFNLRQLDYGLKDGNPRKLVGDHVLKDTGRKPFEDVFGWPTLRLAGGPAAPSAPTAEYVTAEKRIVVRGQGNTLQSISDQLANEALLKCGADGAVLGANLHLVDRAELVLGGMSLRPAPGAPQLAVTVGARCGIVLSGAAVLADVDAAALEDCRLLSLGAHTLSQTRTVRVRAVDKKDRPVVETDVRIVATDKGSGKIALDKDDARLDKDGTVSFALPVRTAAVDGVSVQVRQHRYDLLIDDKTLNASYPIKDVVPGEKPEYRVTFTAHRTVK